jgi:acyl carrier protein
VQVRGFRVEPAEVEAALRRHPAVGQAAVLLREARDGRRALTAWLVPDSIGDGLEVGPEPSPTELREHLRRRLPDPMVPEAFVWLERLPLTPNGKLDRRALPDPRPARATGSHGTDTAPRTPYEQELAAIWREVLALDEVSLEDNFFELGGHSLLATQVASRVQEVLGVDLPLRALFETPTLGGLAARLEALASESLELSGPRP